MIQMCLNKFRCNERTGCIAQYHKSGCGIRLLDLTDMCITTTEMYQAISKHFYFTEIAICEIHEQEYNVLSGRPGCTFYALELNQFLILIIWINSYWINTLSYDFICFEISNLTAIHIIKSQSKLHFQNFLSLWHYDLKDM